MALQRGASARQPAQAGQGGRPGAHHGDQRNEHGQQPDQAAHKGRAGKQDGFRTEWILAGVGFGLSTRGRKVFGWKSRLGGVHGRGLRDTPRATGYGGKGRNAMGSGGRPSDSEALPKQGCERCSEREVV